MGLGRNVVQWVGNCPCQGGVAIEEALQTRSVDPIKIIIKLWIGRIQESSKSAFINDVRSLTFAQVFSIFFYQQQTHFQTTCHHLWSHSKRVEEGKFMKSAKWWLWKPSTPRLPSKSQISMPAENQALLDNYMVALVLKVIVFVFRLSLKLSRNVL